MELVANIDLPRYKNVKYLGRGSYGMVIRGRKDRKMYAVKFILNDDENIDYAPCSIEGKIGQHCSHPNLVKCQTYGAFTLSKKNHQPIWKLIRDNGKPNLGAELRGFFIQTEYCNYQTLKHYLTSASASIHEITQENTERLFLQVTSGVSFLHRNKIIHADLKPGNMYLHRVGRGELPVVKIGDYGGSNFADDDGTISSPCLTPLYTGKSSDGKVTYKDNIYTLGLIYYAMFIFGFCNFDKDIIRGPARVRVLESLVESARNSSLPEWLQMTHPKRKSLINDCINGETEIPALELGKQLSKLMETTSTQIHSFSSTSLGKDPHFRGRSSILQKINDLARSGCCILLHGIAGSGKKATAIEFLNSIGESREFDLFIWFVAGSLNVLSTGYVRLYSHLNLNLQSQDRRKLNWDDKVTAVKNYLQCTTEKRILIVYENIKDYDSIAHLIPHNPASNVIICTPRKDFSTIPKSWCKINVGQLPEPDSIDLVKGLFSHLERPDEVHHRNKANKHKFIEDVKQLAKQMGFLPGAIVQALSFIANPNNNGNVPSIPEYLTLHRATLMEFKRNLLKVPKQDLEPIYYSILTTIKSIEKQNTTALSWLKFCSLLDSQRIPEILLDSYLTLIGRHQDKDSILNILREYRIMTVDDNDSFESVSVSYSITRCVQEVLLLKFRDSINKTLQEVVDVLKSCVFNKKEKEFLNPDKKINFGQLTSHIEAVLENIEIYDNHLEKTKMASLSSCSPSFVFQKLEQLTWRKIHALQSLSKCYTSSENIAKAQSSNRSWRSLQADKFNEGNLVEGKRLLDEGKREFHLACPFQISSADVARHKIPESVLAAKRQKFKSQSEASMIKLEKAEKLLKSAYDANNRNLEICDVYTVLGSCYEFLAREISEIIAGNLATKSNLSKSKEYFQKCLVIKMKASGKELGKVEMIGKTLLDLANHCEHVDRSVEFKEALLIFQLKFYSLGDRYRAMNKNGSKSEAELRKEVDEAITDLKNLLNGNSVTITDETRLSCINSAKNSKKSSSERSALHLLNIIYYKDETKQSLSKLTREVRDSQKTLTALQIKSTVDHENHMQSTLGEPRKYSDKEFQDMNLSQGKLFVKQGKDLKSALRVSEALTSFENASQLYLAHQVHDPAYYANVYLRAAECHGHVFLCNKPKAYEMYLKVYEIMKAAGNGNSKSTNIDLGRVIEKLLKFLPETKLKLKLDYLLEFLTICLDQERLRNRARARVNKGSEQKSDNKHKDEAGQPELPKKDTEHNEIGFIKQRIRTVYLQLGDVSKGMKYLQEAADLFKINLPEGNEDTIKCLEQILSVYKSNVNLLDNHRPTYEVDLKRHRQVAVDAANQKPRTPTKDMKVKKKRVEKLTSFLGSRKHLE